MKILGKSAIGKNVYLGENVIIGHPGKSEKDILISKNYERLKGAIIGDNCTIRDFTTIYSDVVLGDGVNTGHYVLIRERTRIGDKSLIGTGTVIDGDVSIGKHVSIQSLVYIPTYTVIEDNVFVGPRVCFTNDKYMDVAANDLKGITVKTGARIGANTTILPGIVIGKNAVIGAGSVVTKDVPDGMVFVGNPAHSIR